MSINRSHGNKPRKTKTDLTLLISGSGIEPPKTLPIEDRRIEEDKTGGSTKYEHQSIRPRHMEIIRERPKTGLTLLTASGNGFEI
jgi:hypothetical protein